MQKGRGPSSRKSYPPFYPLARPGGRKERSIRACRGSTVLGTRPPLVVNPIPIQGLSKSNLRPVLPSIRGKEQEKRDGGVSLTFDNTLSRRHR